VEREGKIWFLFWNNQLKEQYGLSNPRLISGITFHIILNYPCFLVFPPDGKICIMSYNIFIIYFYMLQVLLPLIVATMKVLR